MVNIVVVSHSRKLAEGVVELAAQMTQGNVKFAVAAGIDDAQNPIGTDPIAVMTAIQDVHNDDGVLVMVDIGSAILSTDLALELLDDAVAANVHVCAAPLVEGTVAAAVAAASGQDIGQVISEAHQALVAKYAQLKQADAWRLAPPPQSQPDTEARSFPLSFSWRVTNPAGIHARPASAISSCLSRFAAEVQLSKGEQSVNAKSMNNIALLAIRCGDEITLQASGAQAPEAIAAFAELAAMHFGDKGDDPMAVVPNAPSSRITKQVSARVCRLTRQLPHAIPRDFLGVHRELALLDKAIDAARQELDALTAYTAQQVSDNEAAIFSAQRMMLDEPEFYNAVAAQLAHCATPADQLWLSVIEQWAQDYHAIEDTYLRERFIDIYDVGFRVWQHLNAVSGSQDTPQEMTGVATVIVANLLLPSEAVTLDPRWIKAVYFTDIGITSHAAILVAALGIPVFSATAEQAQALRHGENITFDVESGNLIIV